MFDVFKNENATIWHQSLIWQWCLNGTTGCKAVTTTKSIQHSTDAFCWPCVVVRSSILFIFYLSIFVLSFHTFPWPPNTFCPCLFPLPAPFYQTPFPIIFQLSHAIGSPDFCPTSHSASPFPSPPPFPLIVLFCTEGYSCLQGYENVRKAHSIFSYVNSHFPPEQTHFPRSDLPRSTFHISLPTSHLLLQYLNRIVRGENNGPPLLPVILI